MGNYFGCYYDESSLTKRDLKNRIRNLKDAVLCIGCMRFLCIFGYLGAVVLLNCYDDSAWSTLLKIMLFIIVIPEIVLMMLLFLGAIKVFAAFYVGLFVLVYWFAEDETWRKLLSILLLVAVPITVFSGIILFYGALDEKVWALEIAIWLCLALATYNTVLGIMGLLYFIREGTKTIHFVIAGFFFLLAISLFAVVCHDIVITYTLKKTLSLTPSQPNTMYEAS